MSIIKILVLIWVPVFLGRVTCGAQYAMGDIKVFWVIAGLFPISRRLCTVHSEVKRVGIGVTLLVLSK